MPAANNLPSLCVAQADTSSSRLLRKSRPSESLRHKRLLLLWPIAPTLRVRILPSSVHLRLTALGADCSLRGEKDGRTYFGCKRRITKEGPVINDVKLAVTDPALRRKHRGRHFVIEFDPFREAYFARDLGGGFGLFARLNGPIRIRDSALVNIGGSYISLNVLSMKSVHSPLYVRVKVYDGVNCGQVYLFEMGNGKVRVGRQAQCEVVICDEQLSKVQCTVSGEDAVWLADGDEDRPSTNGTWLYARDDWELRNGATLRAGPWLLETQICT